MSGLTPREKRGETPLSETRSVSLMRTVSGDVTDGTLNAEAFKKEYPAFLKAMIKATKTPDDLPSWRSQAVLLLDSAIYLSNCLSPTKVAGYSRYFHNPKPKLIEIAALLSAKPINANALLDVLTRAHSSWIEQQDHRGGFVDITHPLHTVSRVAVSLKGFESNEIPALDRALVADALDNVISNAYKYAYEQVVVEYRASENAIYVIDDVALFKDGRTTPEEVLFSGDGERAKASSGKGLGLSRTALQAAGGDINYCEGDFGIAGMKKAIIIKMPKLKELAFNDGFTSAQNRVLLLDDEKTNLRTTERLLSRRVFQGQQNVFVAVQQCFQAQMALHAAEKYGGFTHFVSDNLLGDERGCDFILGNEAYLRRVRVVIVSGDAIADERFVSVKKPFRPEGIRQAFERAKKRLSAVSVGVGPFSGRALSSEGAGAGGSAVGLE